jgi:hypothetical protein
MNTDNDPRFDVKTKTKGTWNPIVQFIDGPQKETTIRDNATGKEYKGSGKTPEQSRDNAWKKVEE